MGTLYKRGSIYWIQGTRNGKRYRISTKTENRQQANLFKSKYEAEIYNKQYLGKKEITFLEAIDNYLSNSKHFNFLCKTTKGYYIQYIEEGKEYFANKIITKKDVYLLINKLSTRDIRPLKDRTIKKYINVYAVIYKEAIKLGLISDNPFEKLDFTVTKSSNHIRFLLKNEYNRLLSINDKDFLDYILFAIETGLRKSEQQGLIWDNINFNDKDLYIKESKTGDSGTVPLSPIAINILNNRLHLTKPFPKIIDHTRFKNTLKSVNIDASFRWHDFRHTCASWLIKGWFSWQTKPMEIYSVSKWLRHKDIKITQIYAHLTVDDLKTNINHNIQ